MCHLAIEEGSQAVLAGDAVQKLVSVELQFGIEGGPFRKLFRSAMPGYMPSMCLNASKACIVQRVGIRALEQRATARPLPFAMLLLQFPRFELSRSPAEIFRRNAVQRRERRHTKARQNVGRNFVEEPRPAPKLTRLSVAHLAVS